MRLRSLYGRYPYLRLRNRATNAQRLRSLRSPTLVQDMSTIEDLLAEFNDPPYTREQFEADYTRIVKRLCEKHGVTASEIPALVSEHRYEHSYEDPEDEYMELMTIARVTGWL